MMMVVFLVLSRFSRGGLLLLLHVTALVLAVTVAARVSCITAGLGVVTAADLLGIGSFLRVLLLRTDFLIGFTLGILLLAFVLLLLLVGLVNVLVLLIVVDI